MHEYRIHVNLPSKLANGLGRQVLELAEVTQPPKWIVNEVQGGVRILEFTCKSNQPYPRMLSRFKRGLHHRTMFTIDVLQPSL